MSNKILIFLVAMLALPVVISASAMAASGMPGDSNKDNTLTKAEMSSTVLSYLSGNGNLNDTRDSAWVYTMWGGKPKTIVDTANHTVTLYKPAHRIVVLGSYAVEAVKLLGTGDRIVAIDSYTKKGYHPYFPELQSLPATGNQFKPDCEAIIAMNPDLVITTADTQYGSISDMVDKLGKFNIPVADLVFYKYQMIDTELGKLGYLLDREGQAQSFISWRNSVERNITDYLRSHPEEKNPKVYMEMDMGGNMTWGNGSNEQAIIDLAGGDNVAKGLGVYSKVDMEYAIKQNPDVIIYEKSAVNHLGWKNSSEPEAVINMLKARPGWSYIDAMKNKRVYVIDTTVMYGPGSTAALAYFAKILHPGMPIDPDQVYAYYMKTFLDVSYPDGTIMVYRMA